LNHKVRNKIYHYYRAKESDCKECALRSKCLAKEDGKARGPPDLKCSLARAVATDNSG
jgi:hypothetical protein